MFRVAQTDMELFAVVPGESFPAFAVQHRERCAGIAPPDFHVPPAQVRADAGAKGLGDGFLGRKSRRQKGRRLALGCAMISIPSWDVNGCFCSLNADFILRSRQLNAFRRNVFVFCHFGQRWPNITFQKNRHGFACLGVHVCPSIPTNIVCATTLLEGFDKFIKSW